MPDYADTLAQLAEAREAAKALLTELRGAIKDSRQAKKEVADYIQSITETVVIDAVNRSVDKTIQWLERRFVDGSEQATRKMSSAAEQVIQELKTKEAFILQTADSLHQIVDTLNQSFTNIKERLDTLEKAHLLMHQQYHALSEVVRVDGERVDNVWKALAAIETILNGLRERVDYLMAELGEDEQS